MCIEELVILLYMYEHLKHGMCGLDKLIVRNVKPRLPLCKNNPSERNESLLADCRAQDVLCKVSVFALYYKIWKVI